MGGGTGWPRSIRKLPVKCCVCVHDVYAEVFYARQLYRQVLLRARTGYGNSVRPSVCLSVTTRYGFKARWDRDSGSSPYDSLESLVFYEVIWCHWVKRSPRTRASKRGAPLQIVILPLLAHLAWERLQIDIDLLLVITSTADELSSGTNIDDLERPWTPKICVSSDFFCYFRLRRTLRVNFGRNYWR